MYQYSIVVVAKDAGYKIGRLLESIQGLSDDIVVCDTGSNDNTIEIARAFGATVYKIFWEGYGKSKNEAIAYAKYDWILSLDSDEKVDGILHKALQKWNPTNDTTVYQLLWKNFFGKKLVKYSDWGSNWKNRLFNKQMVRWDNAIAHENVTASVKLSFKKLNGYLEHYSFQDVNDYLSKMINSARLTAFKYHQQKRKSTYIHLVFSPLICFVKTFFLKVGFLDGSRGWLIAKTSAHYTYLKYQFLWKLNQKNRTSVRFNNNRMEKIVSELEFN